MIQTYPRAKLFTDKDIKVPHHIELVEIEPLESGEAVSKWMLLEYCKYLETDYLLNIQADGFVVNGHTWDPDWLQYDYIGAPWGLHPLHEWPPFPNVTELNRVGNGGFSLRSTNLMVQAAVLFDTNMQEGKLVEPREYHPEDCWICRTNGTLLRELGFQFAPLEVASKFSVENSRITDQFGFHGKLTMKINPTKTRL